MSCMHSKSENSEDLNEDVVTEKGGTDSDSDSVSVNVGAPKATLKASLKLV